MVMKEMPIYGKVGIGCHIDENGNKVYSKNAQNEFKLEQLKGEINAKAKGEFKFEPSFKMTFGVSEKPSTEDFKDLKSAESIVKNFSNKKEVK